MKAGRKWDVLEIWANNTVWFILKIKRLTLNYSVFVTDLLTIREIHKTNLKNVLKYQKATKLDLNLYLCNERLKGQNKNTVHKLNKNKINFLDVFVFKINGRKILATIKISCLFTMLELVTEVLKLI